MEIIGYGVLLAIGWYLAPFVIAFGLYLLALPFAILSKIFK